ncbi:MAG TPA: FAA hydrolase family protein [Bacteroidetes bacterium]|nr:FAA hydrolase family protein [Bacteroidota bacterium]
MKIICIGRNYADHARELNHPLPEKPIFFLKPDSAILIHNKPFYLPDFMGSIHYEAELVVRINRLGKNIAPKFAPRYYDAVTLGIDFTARDLQNECREKGLPWEIAKAFDGSAALGPFRDIPSRGLQNILFRLDVNGRTVQEGNTAHMIFPVNELIAYVSKFMTLRTGDLFFTGTPAGVGPVNRNDRLEAYLEGEKLLDFFIR